MKKLELKDNLYWIIPTLITAGAYAFGDKLIGSLVLIFSFIYLVFHFWENLKFCGKIIVDFLSDKLKIKEAKKIKYGIIGLLIFILIGVVVLFGKSEPEIFSIADGFDLEYEDDFMGGNFDLDNWKIFENKFRGTESASKSLNVSAFNDRGYPLYIDLKNIYGDKIFIGKFQINGDSRVGIRFANTDGYDSSELQKLHFNECVLSSRNQGDIKKGFSHYIYKRKAMPESSYSYYEISNGVYYILAEIIGNKLSCYYQKDGEENYREIIKNEDMVFENLGGPVMTKYIDDQNSYPELLEFKMYIKK